jgi:nifR3 family TIM-barrel protein
MIEKTIFSLSKPIFGLAPMDGITDEPLRYCYASKYKPDLLFTEFINTEALIRNPASQQKKLDFSPIEKPIICQLSGWRPEQFYQASLIVLKNKFDGIDINLGCPSRNVRKSGSGASLIGKNKQVSQIIKAVSKAIGQRGSRSKTMTLSVKTRIGLNQPQTMDWIGFLLTLPLDFITIHGRTTKQGYRGQADWLEIKKAVELRNRQTDQILIFGNGDVTNQAGFFKRAKESGVDGILVGRGALGNPWIFKDISKNKLKHQTPDYKPLPNEIMDFMLYHFQNHIRYFKDRGLLSFRKHFGWYCRGFPEAKTLRQQLMQTEDISDAIKILKLTRATESFRSHPR